MAEKKNRKITENSILELVQNRQYYKYYHEVLGY